MNLLDYFIRWDVLIFAALLVLFSILYKKKGFLKNFFYQSKKEKKQFQNRFDFSIIVILISLISILAYNSSKIFFRNFPSELREAMLIIALIFVFVGIVLWVYLFSLRLTYIKEISSFVFMIFIFYFLNKDINAVIKGILTITFGFSFIILPFYFKKEWKPKKIYFWATILIMLLVFFGGIIIIDSLYGEKTKKIYLNLNIDGNSSNKYYEEGEMIFLTCENEYEKLFVGTNLSCSLNSESIINNMSIIFISLLGNPETKAINNFSFYVPYEISRLIFQLNLTSKDGKEYNLLTSNDYNNVILTLEHDQKRKENLYLWLLALIGAIFISIPLMMKTFKDL